MSSRERAEELLSLIRQNDHATGVRLLAEAFVMLEQERDQFSNLAREAAGTCRIYEKQIGDFHRQVAALERERDEWKANAQKRGDDAIAAKAQVVLLEQERNELRQCLATLVFGEDKTGGACKEEVQIGKGVGYTVDDVEPSVYYCLRTKGHSGPHAIGGPDIATDDDDADDVPPPLGRWQQIVEYLRALYR